MGLRRMPARDEVVLGEVLAGGARRHPRRECVVFEDGTGWTWAAALDEARRAASRLARQGIRTGDRILIFAPNGPGWLRAWWGAATLGAAIVPVNTAFKGGMLSHVCADSGARHIVCDPKLRPRVDDLGLDLVVIDPDDLRDGPAVAPPLERPVEPWDIHAVNYTSGTTGPSKGVLTTYLHTWSQSISFRTRTTPADTVLTDLPLFHSGGQVPAYGLLCRGGRIALRTAFSARRYLDVARESGATTAVLVGSMAAALVTVPERPDDSDTPLRWLHVGPSPTDPEAFMARFGLEAVVTSFSMTEVPTPITSSGAFAVGGSCGRARPGFTLRVVDEHDLPVPPGEPGELILRSDLPWEITPGYLGRPEETARAWRNGWFHTGDLLRCDNDGNWFYVDRLKDAIRRRGENISSFEVEREVLAHPDVAEAACVPVPGELAGDQEVKLFVVARDGADLDLAALTRFLAEQLPYFMVPRYLEPIDELPRTPTMRVKKFELRERPASPATFDRVAAGLIVGR